MTLLLIFQKRFQLTIYPYRRNTISYMAKAIKIKKGLDINLYGVAEKIIVEKATTHYALKPTDFNGVFPKLLVKEGDKVKAGSPVYFDKYRENIIFTSPVSGEITEVKRGRKRVMEEIRIKADEEIAYLEFEKANPNDLDGNEIKKRLLESGLWPLIRQRPYSIIANPDDTPKAVFISGFDTAPLAPDNDFIVHGHGDLFQTGINAISKLTNGKVHLNLFADEQHSAVFTNSKGVQFNYFTGPHPSGNIGVQIHHIDPINKGDTVWYLYPQDVLTIGRLFLEGRYNATKVIALTGSEVLKPRYYRVIAGTSITELITGNLNEGNLRFISGNVFTGKRIERNGYIGFYDTQVTVILEGNYPEFVGWAMPRFKKFSVSRSYFSWLQPGKRKYRLDTNLNGGVRAFVMSGEFEKYFPMNIYPVHLIKAILVKDIDLMENLGIYEVDEEDFALCEFIDTSKIDVQAIVRNGLDYIRKEMS